MFLLGPKKLCFCHSVCVIFRFSLSHSTNPIYGYCDPVLVLVLVNGAPAKLCFDPTNFLSNPHKFIVRCTQGCAYDIIIIIPCFRTCIFVFFFLIIMGNLTSQFKSKLIRNLFITGLQCRQTCFCISAVYLRIQHIFLLFIYCYKKTNRWCKVLTLCHTFIYCAVFLQHYIIFYISMSLLEVSAGLSYNKEYCDFKYKPHNALYI